MMDTSRIRCDVQPVSVWIAGIAGDTPRYHHLAADDSPFVFVLIDCRVGYDRIERARKAA